jgi:hypothetical protein
VSLWLNSGVPATEVARRAGHAVAVLLKVYAHRIASMTPRMLTATALSKVSTGISRNAPWPESPALLTAQSRCPNSVTARVRRR